MVTPSLNDDPDVQVPPAKSRGHLITPLLAALQFLTVTPPLVRRPFTPAELGQAVGFFPLVGVLLGAVLAGLDRLCGLLWPAGVSAALVLAAWVLVTGALHLDGFLDTCDGLFGGHTPEDRLRIMRDHHVGAFAVAGGVLLLLVKYAALAAVPDRTTALLLAVPLGRWGMSLAVVGFPYARAEGLGRAMKDQAGWAQAGLATLTVGAAAWVCGGRAGLGCLLLAAGVVGVAVWYVLGRLPGLTGDIYGALCELVEVVTLLALAAGGRP